MKLCHAAALALAGLMLLSCHRQSVRYLLLLPPWDQTGVKTDTPLSKWKLQDVFATAQECDCAKLQDREKLVILKMDGDPPSIEVVGTCIASDDPRLKEPSK